MGTYKGVLNFRGMGLTFITQFLGSHLLRCMLQKSGSSFFEPQLIPSNQTWNFGAGFEELGLGSSLWEHDLAHSHKRPWDTQVCIERPSQATSEGSSQLKDRCPLTPFPFPKRGPCLFEQSWFGYSSGFSEPVGGFLNQLVAF